MGRIRRRGREIDPEVYGELSRMARETSSSAPQIEAELHRRFSPGRKVPSQKVIQRVVKEERPQDPTGPWRLAEADDPADAALVLPVLVVTASGWPLTTAEAGWVVRIRKAAPSVPLNAVFMLVRTYMSWEQRGRPTELLDLVLACAPWRDDTNLARMERLLFTFGDEGREAKQLGVTIVIFQEAPHFEGNDSQSDVKKYERWEKRGQQLQAESLQREERLKQEMDDEEYERPHP